MSWELYIEYCLKIYWFLFRQKLKQHGWSMAQSQYFARHSFEKYRNNKQNDPGKSNWDWGKFNLGPELKLRTSMTIQNDDYNNKKSQDFHWEHLENILTTKKSHRAYSTLVTCSVRIDDICYFSWHLFKMLIIPVNNLGCWAGTGSKP